MSEVAVVKKRLKKFEKETHIQFDEYNLTATIQTYNQKWINRLIKKCGIQPVVVQECGLHIFEGVPAHWMLPRKPPRRTEAQIEASKRNIKNLIAKSEDAEDDVDFDEEE